MNCNGINRGNVGKSFIVRMVAVKRFLCLLGYFLLYQNGYGALIIPLLLIRCRNK